jgi:hypothetical protein
MPWKTLRALLIRLCMYPIDCVVDDGFINVERSCNVQD